MKNRRVRNLSLVTCLAFAMPACGPSEKPVSVQKGIEEAAKAAEGGKAMRQNQPKKPPVERRQTGPDTQFPGPN